MRPSNEEERMVDRLHKEMPSLSMSQMNWMLGQTYEDDMLEFGKIGKKIDRVHYFGIVTTKKGWQVTRYFLVHSLVTKKDGHQLDYIMEISQRWMRVREDRSFALYIFEKQKQMNWQWKYQPYALSADLSLKTWSTSWNRNGRTYFCLADEEIYPRRRFSKEFIAKGLARLSGRADEICMVEDIKRAKKKYRTLALDKSRVLPMAKRCYLPTMSETLYKMGENALAEDVLTRSFYGTTIKKYWKSFLIARRHGMVCDDWHQWFDYVRDLDDLGRDIHSPKYLVPLDLGKAHARVLEKITERDARNRTERDKEEIAKQEKSYAERIKAYIGLVIPAKGGLTISPIDSVLGIWNEGRAMHHCVFSCGIYKKESSLILSAKDKNGKRVETIEVDTSNYRIVQSRGVCNKATEYHKQIVDSVNENMWRIKACKESSSVRMAC